MNFGSPATGHVSLSNRISALLEKENVNNNTNDLKNKRLNKTKYVYQQEGGV